MFTGQSVFAAQPPHVYGMLSRSLLGCSLLSNKGIVKDLIKSTLKLTKLTSDVIADEPSSPPDSIVSETYQQESSSHTSVHEYSLECSRLKEALWSLGHIASTDLGYQLLERVSSEIRADLIYERKVARFELRNPSQSTRSSPPSGVDVGAGIGLNSKGEAGVDGLNDRIVDGIGALSATPPAAPLPDQKLDSSIPGPSLPEVPSDSRLPKTVALAPLSMPLEGRRRKMQVLVWLLVMVRTPHRRSTRSQTTYISARVKCLQGMWMWRSFCVTLKAIMRIRMCLSSSLCLGVFVR